ALVVRHRTRNDNARRHHRTVHTGHGKQHLAVVDQQRVARLYVTGQSLEGGGDDLLGTFNVFGSDLEDVTLGEVVRAVSKAAKADLRTLQVHHDGDGLARLGGCATHVRVVL